MAEDYSLTLRDLSIVASAKALLWKVVRAGKVQDVELKTTMEILYVLDRLPESSAPLHARLDVRGPTRVYGDHRIRHAWSVEIEGHRVEISSGGSFYRDSTGSDSFSCMNLDAAPGYPAVLDDYLAHLGLVDDAMPSRRKSRD